MTVFKNYFKIVKRHMGLIIMFSAIAIIISIANTNSGNTVDTYVNVEPTVAVFNYDKSELSKNLVEYIEKNAKIVEIENNEKSMQDSLYSNKVDSVLIIPENFANDMLSGKNVNIEIKKSTQNMSEQVELIVNKYYKIASIYGKAGFSEEQVIEKTKKVIESQVDVKVVENNKGKLEKVAIFYSFENYSFLSIFIFIIGTIMCVFNKDEIKKRNVVSSTHQKEFSKQLFLGHLCLTLGLWFIYGVISVVIYKELMFTFNGLLMIVNSLIFSFTVTSLAYMISKFIKKQNVISGIQNVVSLGLSFISGCFISAELIDEKILNFSKIFPSYWFIQGNHDIARMSEFGISNMYGVFVKYGIILGFGLLYFIIAQFGSKR